LSQADPAGWMKQLCEGITRSLLPVSLSLMACVGGCATGSRPLASGSANSVFIAYWPPKENKELRLAVKDNIDMQGVVTTVGSKYVAKTGLPATSDAECLAIARKRRVQIVGKTNLSEFAVAPSGLNDYFGTPNNPLSQKGELIPGGSSSGSAVAVANGLADIAFGTDTAGSVRVPAACGGILGLKTTFGLVSLKGVIPVEPRHLDTVGPMAKDISHLVQGMELLEKGFSAHYSKAVAVKPVGKKIRIGRLYLSGTDPRIDSAIDRVLSQGQFQVVRLDEAFKHEWDQAQRDGITVAAAGAWLNDGKYFGKPDVSARTKAILTLGEFQYAMNYRQALKRQVVWQETLRQVFEKVDFIALPTLQQLPPKISRFWGSALFEAQVLGLQNTAAVNFAGNPALAIPVPILDKSASVTSLQLVGAPLSEAELLNAGRLIEKELVTAIHAAG
jgi:amidase